MLLDLLHWLDADPLRFRGAAWGLLALVAAAALAPRLRPGWWRSPVVFGAAVLLALVAFRWPTILFNRTLGNPDESQFLAGALTLAHDPVPYRSVDTHTAGPLTPLAVLALARLTGLPVDFTTARLLGLWCAWAMVLAHWRTLRVAFDETTARVLVLPLTATLATVFHPEITELLTEQLPAALLAGALWALAPLLAGRSVSRARLLLAGILLGTAPLTKPQAVPIGAVLGLAGLWLLWRQTGNLRTAWRPAVVLVAGSLAPLLVLVFTILAAGAIREFFSSFIAANVGYVQAPHYPWMRGFAEVARMARELTPFHVTYWAAGVTVLPALALGWSFPPVARRLLGTALVTAAAALVAVLTPARAFPHYLFFLFGPASLLLAAFAGGVLQLTAEPRFRWVPRGARPGLWAIWVAGILVPIVWLRVSDLPGPVGLLGQPDAAGETLRTLIRPCVHPGDSLSVWGWMPEYYVQTGLRQATREGQTQLQIEPSPWRDARRARYLADLQRQPPAIFIDATGPGNWDYDNTAAFGHETFPALARWIGLNYLQIGSHNHGRVFALRGRVPAADPTAGVVARLFPAASAAPAGFLGTEPQLVRADNPTVVLAHAPCTVLWRPFATEQVAHFAFGLFASAYSGEGNTDGVVFRVVALDPEHGTEQTLFERHLQPLTVAADRGESRAQVVLPAGVAITFETDPGPANNAAFDWAYWRDLRIDPAGP